MWSFLAATSIFELIAFDQYQLQVMHHVRTDITMTQYLSIGHRLCRLTFWKLLRLTPKLNPSHLSESTYQVFSLCYFQPAQGGPEIEVGRMEPDKTDCVKDQWIPDFWRETVKVVKTTEVRSHFHRCTHGYTRNDLSSLHWSMVVCLAG